MRNHLNNVTELWEAKKFPKKQQFKLLLWRAPAGFPSPAEDHVESSLDLNEYLVDRPATTYFARLGGDSMTNVGMYEGDVVSFDRSKEVKHGDIIFASLRGAFSVKRLYKVNDQYMLCPENDDYKPIVLTDADEPLFTAPITGLVRKF